MVNVIKFDSFGLENLKVTEQAPEPLGPNDVRVKVHAVSLNYRDYMMVKGLYNPRLPLPLIPCSDGAGTVLELGAEVRNLAPGDRVISTMIPAWEGGLPEEVMLQSTLGGPKHGMLAQERVLPQEALLPIPDHLSFQEAACLPVAGLTAWNALQSWPTINSQKAKVLLLGTGGVSIMALGIAAKLNAEIAITSGSDEKLARAQAMGAHHIVNYKTNERWDKVVRGFWPGGADVVLEVGGDGTFDTSVKCLRAGGSLALIGVLAHQNKPVNLTALLMRGIKVQGIIVGSRADFRSYLQFVDAYKPEVVVGREFQGLEQAQAAFEHLASGSHFGKIVITL